MTTDLRQAWAHFIRADDYETHMAAVGQAEANAFLVRDYFAHTQLQFPPDAQVLFLGAGTGQMFDYVSSNFLRPFRTTFTDLNSGYLARLEQRISSDPALRFQVLTDDVEHTRLQPVYSAIIAVLLLEHVHWQKAVASICALAPQKILFVIQQNSDKSSGVLTPSPTVPGTMNVFRNVHPRLLQPDELEGEMLVRGFASAYLAERGVTDGKKMVALGFQRRKGSPAP